MIGVTEHDATGIFNLVIEKLAKVFHVQLAFVGVDHCRERVKRYVIGYDTLHGTDNVGQLAHTRRLDQNAIRGKVTQYLSQCLGKVTYQGATDAALVHFGDLNPTFL